MKIFVDLDSTLNRLQDAWLEAIKHQLGEIIERHEVTHWDRLGDERYQRILRVPRFFRNLAVEDGSQRVLEKAQAAGHQIYILSAAGSWNASDKFLWVQEYFPFIDPRRVILATCKGELARQDRMLIDDGPHNLEEWDRAGGIAVAYSQPWNQSWNGLRIGSWLELETVLGLVKPVQAWRGIRA